MGTWIQPVLTANGTIGQDDFAVLTGGGAESNAYKAFDSSTSSWVNKMNASAWLMFYVKAVIKINSIVLYSDDGYLPQSGILRVSYDEGTTWTQVGSWQDTEGTSYSATVVIDTPNVQGNYWQLVSQGVSIAHPRNNADFTHVAIDADVISSTLNVSFDVVRKIKNAPLVWRYFNAGTADLLSSSGTTLTNLTATQSKTGSAFYQTTRAKCFDIPATKEIWIRFDVYTKLSTRWRAYNEGSADVCGVCSQTSGDLTFWANGNHPYSLSSGVKNQLQTVVLHMVSGTTDGIVEAWLDGEFVYRYTGNVNNGADFADIYLQSDGSDTFFSNVIISNVEIVDDVEVSATFDVESRIRNAVTASFDTERRIKGDIQVSASFDVERRVENINKIAEEIAEALKVWLPFDVSPTHDICGNSWLAIGKPTIQNNELDLGGSSYLKMGTNLTITKGRAFTVCCWFSTTGHATGEDTAEDLWILIDGDYYYSVMLTSDNQLMWSRSSAQIAPSTAVADGKKHFLEAVFTGDSKRAAAFFLDGEQVAYVANALPNETSDTTNYTLGIGGRRIYGALTDIGHVFNGRIDEFQIYDGLILHDKAPTPPTVDFYRAQLASFTKFPIVFSASMERRVQNAVSILYDLMRYAITSQPWKYYSHGAAGDLLICGTTVTDLPKTQSRTGTAYKQDQRQKSFNIPPSEEIWLKFDFYSKDVLFAGNDGDYFIRCGVALWMGYLAFYGFEGRSGFLGSYDVLKEDTLQTILLHLKTGTTDGIIEAWIDGEFIARHVGNVNGGLTTSSGTIRFPATVLDDISLQGSKYSNIMVSNVQIGFEEGYCENVFDAERVIKASGVVDFNCDTERRLPHQLIITPTDLPEQVDTTGVQSITIDLAAQQFTDQLSFSWIHPVEIMQQIRGQYLDYKFDMRIEEITQNGILATCHCCSDIDLLLYTQFNYEIDPNYCIVYRADTKKRLLERMNSGWTASDIEDVEVKKATARYHLYHFGDVLGIKKQGVIRFDDFVSDMEIEQKNVTYADLISNLFGWTSRIPQMMIHCYLRDDKLYVIQRGHEENEIDITNLKHTAPTVNRKIMRTTWGSSPDEEYSLEKINPGLLLRPPPPKVSEDGKTFYTYKRINPHGYLLTGTRTQNDDGSVVEVTYSYTLSAPYNLTEEHSVTRDSSGKITDKHTVQHNYLTPSQTHSVWYEDGNNEGSVIGSHVAGFYDEVITLRETTTDTKTFTIYGNPLIDTSFPVVNQDKLAELSAAIRWLNRKTQETISMDIYNYPHVIDFNDRIIFNGNTYFLDSNSVTRTPRIVNKQSITIVRWY